MARPQKEGIDYFPLDVGFFRDKKTKLIKGEYGAKGLVIFLALLTKIYESKGYYIFWDEDDCTLLADEVGCGVTSRLVKEVVDGCIKRFFFDEKVFNLFRILTSRGIQKRYIRAIATREKIVLDERYLLLNLEDVDDVPASLKAKIALKNVSLQINGVSLQRNEVDLQINPQSRVEESKVKESKVEERRTEISTPTTSLSKKYGKSAKISLTDDEYSALEQEFGLKNLENYIQRMDAYLTEENKSYRDYSAQLKKWMTQDKVEISKKEASDLIAKKYEMFINKF